MNMGVGKCRNIVTHLLFDLIVLHLHGEIPDEGVADSYFADVLGCRVHLVGLECFSVRNKRQQYVLMFKTDNQSCRTALDAGDARFR